MCVCAGQKLYDVDSDTCIPREDCGDKYTYELDGTFIQCVSDELCTERGGYLFHDTKENKCVEDCPTSFFETVDDARVCVSDCGGRFVDGRECVDTCQSGAFEDVTGKLTYKKCVDLGSCSHYIYEDVKVGENFVSYAHCIDSCPETLPVLTTGSAKCQTCEEASGGQKPYWTGSGESESACVATCESGRYKYTEASKKCVDACGEN